MIARISSHRPRTRALLLRGGVFVAALVAAAPPDNDVRSSGGPPQIRKLTQQQYRYSIQDVFGERIAVEGRLPPDQAAEGLIAIGASSAGVSATGAEYYAKIAASVAGQVLDHPNRERYVPCKPAERAWRECAALFHAKYAPLLLRRPVSADELRRLGDVAATSAKITGDFHDGLKFSLIRLLASPEFLFRIERTEGPAGAPRLTAASRAARLSFLLWNGPPDAALLDAAAAGELDSPAGLDAQVARMMASPKFERGARSFFEDMLRFADYETLAKDPKIYPLATTAMIQASREQVLRTIVDQLLVADREYRTLFTTRETMLNRPLGLLYRAPVRSEEGWERHEWAPGDRRAGILTQAGFLALRSHPGSSSPTLRGLAVRNIFLCQQIPPPPSGVDFSLALDVHSGRFRTARDRLTAHMKDPTCASCHRLMDPIGFALENYDGAGQYRATENGAPIDAAGELNGVSFSNAAGLGETLANDPLTGRCLVNRLVSYGLGRVPIRGERRWVASLIESFAADGRFKPLIARIAASPSFYMIDPQYRPSPGQRDSGATAARTQASRESHP